MKELLGVIAVILTFVAYIPYFRDILRHKTHPHLYTWSLWGLLTVLIVALQIKGGAGPATFITAAAGVMCLGVIVLSFKHSKRDITLSDTIVFCLGLTAVAFWLIADQPVVSMLLVIAADLLAFIPTVRKSWSKPYTETLSLYVTNALRFALGIFAIKEYTFLSTAWLAVWAIANVLFSVFLVVRRKQV